MELINALANSGLGLTHDSTPEQIYAALATKFPPTKSLIIPGWIYSGALTASVVSNTNQVKMTITNTPSAGYGYYTSPKFDITSFKSLQLIGTSYKVTGNPYNVNYCPTVDLVNAITGAVVNLYRHTNTTTENTSYTINSTINVESYSGDYFLRMQIYSYSNGDSSNTKAYINLTKALLSA